MSDYWTIKSRPKYSAEEYFKKTPAQLQLRLLEKWIKPSKEMSILDVGCAWGYMLSRFSDNCGHVTGIDNNKEMISAAGEMTAGRKNVSLDLADARKLPFEDCSFDAVYSLGVIEHFPESMESLKEMVRVTKPSGTVVVSVPNAFNVFNRLYRSMLIRSGRLPGYMQKYYTSGALKKMMHSAGLSEIEVSGYGAGLMDPPAPGRLKRLKVFGIPGRLHYSVEKRNTFLSRYLTHMVIAKGVKR